MRYEVTISERAEKNLDKIVKYLVDNWSEKEKKAFIKKLESEVNRLSKNPFIYQVSELNKDVRRCIITKQNALYYRIKEAEKEIEVITIHDTRSDPKSLKL